MIDGLKRGGKKWKPEQLQTPLNGKSVSAAYAKAQDARYLPPRSESQRVVRWAYVTLPAWKAATPEERAAILDGSSIRAIPAHVESIPE